MIRASSVFVVAAIACLSAISSAQAVDVTVQGTAAPWDPAVAGNGVYGNPGIGAYGLSGATFPTFLAVTPGDNITITALSGETFSFGAPFTPGSGVGAGGYDYLIFGSGPGPGGPEPDGSYTGIGFFTPLPSFYIDPTNSGPDNIYLNELLGDFVDAAGKIISPVVGGGANGAFAVGSGPFSVIAPVGAVGLQLGLNDDNFEDNSGSLSVRVTGITPAVPVPGPIAGAGLLPLLGLAGGWFARRRKQRETA